MKIKKFQYFSLSFLRDSSFPEKAVLKVNSYIIDK